MAETIEEKKKKFALTNGLLEWLAHTWTQGNVTAGFCSYKEANFSLRLLFLW